MSQANDLLNSISEPTAGTVAEGNLIIGRDRYITVPESLKKVAVQFDHNVETVTFDCPRYWDEWDFSTMKIYINYMREDGKIGMHWCQNVVVDAEDSDMIHFDWTISGHVTAVQGHISFLVCVKNVDTEGTEITHWNSELNTEMYVSEGLKCQPTILKHYPDIITQLLVRMETAETNLQTWIKETEKEIADWEANLKKDINTWETNTYNKMDTRMKTAESNTTPAEILRRINNALDTNAETQQQIYDAAADYLRDGIVATGKIEQETNAYLEENLAIIADDLLDITLENTIEKSGVVIPSGEGNMLPVKIMGDSYQKQLSGVNLVDFGNIYSENNGIISFADDIVTVTQDGTSPYQMGKIYVTDLIVNNPNKSVSIGFEKFEVTNSGAEARLQFRIYFKDGGETTYHPLYTHSNASYKPYTIPSDTSNISYATLNIVPHNGGEALANTVTITKPIVYFGTEKPDYEPYCGGQPSPNPEFPQEIENVGVVRNLLDCSGLVEKTVNGVTFTPVYDEDGLLEYINVNGTATADSYYRCMGSGTRVNTYDDSYILNGCPSDGSSSTYQMIFQQTDDNGVHKKGIYDYGRGVVISDEHPKCYVDILIKSGYTANKLRFYPMIRPASIADPTYHPYIPENKENLLDLSGLTTQTINGVTFTVNAADGAIVANGTPSYNTFYYMKKVVLDVGEYVLDAGVYVNDTTRMQVVNVENPEIVYAMTKMSNVIKFTITESVEVDVIVRVASGYTANNLVFKPRLRPNHIPAQGSQYAVEVKSVGKNLLDYDSWKAKLLGTSGIVATRGTCVFENNGITITATGNDAYTQYHPDDSRTLRIPVEKGKTVILSWEESTNKEGSVILFLNGSATDGITANNASAKQVSCLIRDNIEFVTIRFGVKNSGDTISYKNIMLRYADVEDDTWQPYQSHSTTIHLDEPLRGIGEYKDTICQKDGVWGVERKRRRMLVDVSLMNKSGNTIADRFVLSSDKFGEYPPIGHSDGFCNVFTWETTNHDEIGTCWVDANSNFICDYSEYGTTTLAQFRSVFSEKLFEIEYALATPTFTPFEDQKQFWKMMAFDGATTISIIDGSDNTVPVGVFRVGRNQDGGKLLSHHSTLNNMEDLEGKITPIPILQADYDKLPESKKKNGIYIITDANVTSFTGNTVRYTGGRAGLGDTVDKAISTVDEKVEERLTASDGTKFRFGVNNEGEYGYIVTDSEGADTFFPFKDLERDTAATAAAAQITEGYTAWVNGKLIVGTRPAAPKTLSGEFYRGIGEGVATYKYQIDFSPAFDVIPEFTYNIQLGNNDTTGQLLYVKRDHAMFQIVHSKGNESSSVRITWTATVQ